MFFSGCPLANRQEQGLFHLIISSTLALAGERPGEVLLPVSARRRRGFSVVKLMIEKFRMTHVLWLTLELKRFMEKKSPDVASK
jgi:hypothetical protein